MVTACFHLTLLTVLPWKTILQDEELNGISEVSCSNQGEEHKMAVRHGTYNAAITCYSVNMKCDSLVVQDL